MLDPSEHILGGKVLRTFPSSNAGLEIRRRIEESWHLRCLVPQAREAEILSFFSRVDLLNRTDPGEAVRNVEYML
jgi:hypothetical protein